MSDFRIDFKNLDETALINIDEFAELMGLTPGALAQKRHLGELLEPCIQGGKVLRWRAGDVRQWLKELHQDHRSHSSRAGRPRKALNLS